MRWIPQTGGGVLPIKLTNKLKQFQLLAAGQASPSAMDCEMLNEQNCPKNLISSCWASVSSYGGKDDDIDEACSILDDKGFEKNVMESNEHLALRIEAWENKDANNLIIAFRGTVPKFPNIYSDIAIARYALSNSKESPMITLERTIKDNIEAWIENEIIKDKKAVNAAFANSCLEEHKKFITPQSILIDSNRYALEWVNKHIDKIDRAHHLNVTYTGHSLGGFIANTVSELTSRIPSSSIVFNAPCGVQKFIEECRKDILGEQDKRNIFSLGFSFYSGISISLQNHDFRKMTINIARYRDTVGRIGGDDVCRKSLIVRDHKMDSPTDPLTYVGANHNIGNLARYLNKKFDY